MKQSHASAINILFTVLLVAQLVGCQCGETCGPCSYDNSCEGCPGSGMLGISPPCHGYHTTCWRPWPEECVTCPAPSRLPPAFEVNEEPRPAVTPQDPTEPLPLPPQPEPPATPSEPGENVPKQEPANPPEPAPARPLETRPPASPPDSGEIQPQSYQFEIQGASPAARDAEPGNQVSSPRTTLAPIIVVEANASKVRPRNGLDQSQSRGSANPGAPLPDGGLMKSQRIGVRTSDAYRF